MLGKLSVPGRSTNLDIVGQGPALLKVDGGGSFFCFFFTFFLSFFSLSLGDDSI